MGEPSAVRGGLHRLLLRYFNLNNSKSQFKFLNLLLNIKIIIRIVGVLDHIHI